MPGCDVEPGRRTCRDCPNWTSCDDPQGLALRVARADAWLKLNPARRPVRRDIWAAITDEGLWYEISVPSGWTTSIRTWADVVADLQEGGKP